MEGYAAAVLAALGIAFVLGTASQFELGRFLFKKRIKLIFFLSVIVIFSFAGYLTIKQYFLWLHDPLARFLLPPYQGLSYFAFYALSRFFASYLVSFSIALTFLQASKIVNQRLGEKFFEKEEPYLAAIALFLVGHPGWLVYLASLVLVYFILHVAHFILQRQPSRLPLYRLWAPTAFFVILLNEYWTSYTHWWALTSF